MSVLASDWLYMQSFEMALRERNFHDPGYSIDLSRTWSKGNCCSLRGSVKLTSPRPKPPSLRSARLRASSVVVHASARCWDASRSGSRHSPNTDAMQAWRFSLWMIFWTLLLRTNNLASRC